jgi:catechol 2,3-dioxygenase-like lactoylglutathione lyase family enzyme
MVGYATLGTNDPERAQAFYDALLALLGAKRLMEIESFVLWGTALDAAGLALTKPYDGNPASVGNGVMVALRAPSKAVVDALHAKALELGGTDEGAPGSRGAGFYAAYFRDLDGNKLNAFFLG